MIQSIIPQDRQSYYLDWFEKYGLYAVPRKSGEKYPLTTYWKQNGEPVPTYDKATRLSDQYGTGWCIVLGDKSNRVIALDFDKMDNFNMIQGLCPSKFMFKTPSGGVHVLYRWPDGVAYPVGTGDYKGSGMDIRTMGNQIASLGSRFTYTGKKAASKGLTDGYTGRYDYHPDANYADGIPTANAALVAWLTPEKTVKELRQERVVKDGEKRHAAMGDKPKEREVAAMVKWVLDHENTKMNRDDWRAFVWAAAQGSQTELVYKTIENHAIWNTSYSGSKRLERLHTDFWEDVAREDGYTVGTLYKMAFDRGFGTTSPQEVTPTRAIDSKYVSEVLTDNLPLRALLKSYTGSGKTKMLRQIIPTDKQTLIIAPTKALVRDVASEYGAMVYLDDTGRIRPTDEMLDAKVLAVTPQSATRLMSNLENYGLIWIEEVEQIIAAAVQPERGEFYTVYQSKEFFKLLRTALQSDCRVWGVDAGITQLSVAAFKAFAPDIEVIVNSYTPEKAPVTLPDDPETAVRAGLDAVARGERVLFCTDRRGGKYGSQAISRAIKRGHLLVDGGTVDTKQVRDFMAHVNDEIQKYSVLVYSPSMKSGVDITSVQFDTVIQLCTFLTPRDNLQMLNRARRQGRVVAYVGIPRYLDSIDTPAEAKARLKAKYNAQVSVAGGLPLERDEIAALIDDLNILRLIDEQAQTAFPDRFYTKLLQSEGRKVTDMQSLDLKDTDRDSLLDQSHKERIRKNWPHFEPINVDNPPKPDDTAYLIAGGREHSYINGVTLKGYIDDLKEGRATAESVYDVAHAGVKAQTLEIAVGIKEQTTHMREQLLDESTPITAIEVDIAEYQALSCLAIFGETSTITAEMLLELSKTFVDSVERIKGAYDLSVGSRKRFDIVYEANKVRIEEYDLTTIARQLASNILAIAGLKLREKRRSTALNPQTGKRMSDWQIDNYEKALQLLRWRAIGRNPMLPADERLDPAKIAIVFKSEAAEINQEATIEALKEYGTLSDDDQETVLDLMRSGLSLPKAVKQRNVTD